MTSISEVEILGTTLLNNTGTATSPNISYTYYTGQPNYTASLQAATTYQIEITIGSFTGQNIAVWIDFNENGVFETPSERVGWRPGEYSVRLGGFPAHLALQPHTGVKRMRVREVWSTAANTIDPCATYGWGETEDYDVTVTPPPPCPAPSGFLAGNASGSTADLSWVAGCVRNQLERGMGCCRVRPRHRYPCPGKRYSLRAGSAR
ncbi:MAG: hypothetical protein IPG69_02935 [Flavobacteriales bacterium]|nr:hypothetical protein [Flavobacteriales bacterium]